MNIFSVIASIVLWLVTNHDEVLATIKNIEQLIPDAPGGSKAAVIKSSIVAALGVGDKIDQAWEIVGPLVFNPIVARVKGPKSAPAA